MMILCMCVKEKSTQLLTKSSQCETNMQHFHDSTCENNEQWFVEKAPQNGKNTFEPGKHNFCILSVELKNVLFFCHLESWTA